MWAGRNKVWGGLWFLLRDVLMENFQTHRDPQIRPSLAVLNYYLWCLVGLRSITRVFQVFRKRYTIYKSNCMITPWGFMRWRIEINLKRSNEMKEKLIWFVEACRFEKETCENHQVQDVSEDHGNNTDNSAWNTKRKRLYEGAEYVIRTTLFCEV